MPLQSFKNVGIREFQTLNIRTTTQSVLPIGIKTPVEFGGNGEGLFAMHTNVQDAVHDNLRNLLLTNYGDRLVQYDFGANLRPLVADFSSKDNFDDEAKIRINSAVSRWMPFISLIGFDSFPEFIDNRYTGKIVLLVIYSIPQLGVTERALEVLLYVI